MAPAAADVKKTRMEQPLYTVLRTAFEIEKLGLHLTYKHFSMQPQLTDAERQPLEKAFAFALSNFLLTPFTHPEHADLPVAKLSPQGREIIIREMATRARISPREFEAAHIPLSQRVASAKRATQNDPLLPMDQKILQTLFHLSPLGASPSPGQIAQALKYSWADEKSRSAVQQRITFLKNKGYVTETIQDKRPIVQLTATGAEHICALLESQRRSA